MLSFLRRITSSRIGMVVTLIALGVIALAFAAGGMGSLTPNSAPTGKTVAQVGDTAIGEAELRNRLQVAVSNMRQRQPSVTMSQFLAQGGMDNVVDSMISGVALERFAHDSGMAVSKKFIDGRIASIPAFQGVDGTFDQNTFDRILAQQGITTDQIREDIRRQTLVQWLVAPISGARQVATQLAMPYASLMLEKRHGAIGFVPTRTINPGDEPDDKALATYYKRHIQRYTVPERRVIRYAMVSPDDVADKAKPSDAAVAKAYRAAGDKYAAREERSLDQVVVADQATAKQIAAKVKSGTSVSAAADAAGLESSTVSDAGKGDLADQSSDAVAQAAFSADKGALVGPVQSPLGWIVARVTDVTRVPGKSLAQAKPEIVETLTKQNKLQLLSNLQDRLDDGITDGSTFSELVGDTGLKANQTAPLTESGVDPDKPDDKPDPDLNRIVEAGFAARQGDSPQLVQVGDSGAFALVALGKTVPSAARPLKTIHDGVMRDYMIEQAKQGARDKARKAVKAVNDGTSLRQAMIGTGLRIPPPQDIDISRGQLAQNRQKVPPPVALLFSMTEGKAKLLEAPNNTGWFVVHLDKIDKGDAKGNADLIKATRQGLGGVIGEEYAEQFAKAVRLSVGVQKNQAAIADLNKAMGGGPPAP